MARRRDRWRGSILATLSLVVAGVAAGNGTLLLSATLPLAYLAYGAVSTATIPDGLVVQRDIAPRVAPPGQRVTVTVTMTNGSEQTLADVRLVDRVPGELAVTGGSPRGGETLTPGETLTLEYSVVARRGEYAFPPPRVRLRGTGAGTVATSDCAVTGDERLICRLDADAPPLSDSGDGRIGRLTTDTPGAGLTFHSTREYRHGDPAGRIDWRGYAKRGALATINYDRSVSATVVFVLDARASSRVAAGPGWPDGVELSAYATTRALNALLRAGHDIAVAAVGVAGDGPAGLAWLPPGSGHKQRSLALSLLGGAVESAPATDGVGFETQCQKIGELLDTEAQLVFVSPMLDDPAVEVVESWARVGTPRTVLSPDVVASNTVSGQYEQVRRQTRLARCQSTGTRTIDWRRGTPLPVILAATFAVEARRPNATGGGH